MVVNNRNLGRRVSRFQNNSPNSESSDYFSEMNKSVF